MRGKRNDTPEAISCLGPGPRLQALLDRKVVRLEDGEFLGIVSQDHEIGIAYVSQNQDEVEKFLEAHPKPETWKGR